MPSVVGIWAVTAVPMPGLVPYVIMGSMSAALYLSSLSNTAFSSLLSVFQ